MEDKSKYNRWTKDALIQRIQALESDIWQRDHRRQEEEATSNKPVEPALAAAAAATVEGVTASAPDDAPQKKKKKSALGPRKRPTDRKIDPSRYTTRLVALKLAYLGRSYGGFEYQASAGVPTVEEELWKALVKACLIFPESAGEVRLDDPACQYSKCGRTDRGVSAFGQVVAIRLRSNRPKPKVEGEGVEKGKDVEAEAEAEAAVADETQVVARSEETTGVQAEDPPAVGEKKGKKKKEKKAQEEGREFDDFVDEVQYCKVLNRLLPKDIRVLAWCPTTPEDFSARHHCRERQYRYFFTQPAYPPMPSFLEDPDITDKGKKPKDGWLDIEAMRDAAKRFEGLHDFRNFCKVDPSKLITNFDRRIFESDIVEVPDVETALPFLSGDEYLPTTTTGIQGVDRNGKFPKVYYFHVRGSAFLWHQIRCMVAVLFTVGQGLEDPSVVDRLLDIGAQPRRPNYVLASETPLVLWDCVFPDLSLLPSSHRDPPRGSSSSSSRHVDAMRWVHLGEDSPGNKHAPQFGLVDDLWETWRERKLDELLAGQLLGLVAARSDPLRRLDRRAPEHLPTSVSQRVFEGGSRPHAVGRYQRLLERKTAASPEELYDREARRKGYGDAAEWREAIARKRAEAVAAEAAEAAEVEAGKVDAATADVDVDE